MKRLAISMLLILSTTALLAQTPRGCNMKNMPKYDASTVQTITGTIASIDRQDHGNHVGIFLKLSTPSDITVHVGPEAYLNEKGFQLAAGQTITVKGSVQHMRGSDVLVAGELQNGSNTLALRDASGKPLWSQQYCNR